jgi:hypothetical protein
MATPTQRDYEMARSFDGNLGLLPYKLALAREEGASEAATRIAELEAELAQKGGA